MKLLKKLLPIATIASTALVVSPFVTSCSKGVTSFDWTPKYQREQGSVEISFDDLTNYASLSREYFEDKQNKYFMEDVYYIHMLEIKEESEQIKKQTYISDLTTTFNVSLDNLKLTQKNAKCTFESKEVTVYGYLISCTLNVTVTHNFKYTNTKISEEDPTISKIESQIEATTKTAYNFDNWFACLYPISGKFRYAVFPNADAYESWTYLIRTEVNNKSKNTYSYTDGTTRSDDLYDNYADSTFYSNKKGDKHSGYSEASYYLDKTTYTIKQ